MDNSSGNLHGQQSNEIENEKLANILFLATERLDEAGKTSATRAFNLGCLLGAVPVLFITLIAILLTKSWLAGMITAFLMLIALLGFANLVALITRSNTMKRVYDDEVSHQIEQMLTEANISKEILHVFADENLPNSATLREYIPELRQAETYSRLQIKLPTLRKRT